MSTRRLKLMQIFGDNLAELLEWANTSQKELAEDTGLSESTISRYVRGETMPTLKNIVNIAYALDCDIDELITVIDYVE